MFLVATKTVIIEALQALFDSEYPESDFRDLWVSMEYPREHANYPGIWVDFDPTADVQNAGIGHVEYVDNESGAGYRKVYRWRFAGMITMTMVAMSSLERDRLADSLAAIIAFGANDDSTSEFRASIEHNDLVGLQIQWDKFALSGKAETPGTPWGTDDVVYEITITMDCQGEFISDGSSTTLVPLSEIVIYDRRDDEPDPSLPPSTTPNRPDTEWH